MEQVIVIGGGLSGLSAAHTAFQNGCKVLLIDKKAILGGNSTKATSGINGAGTETQRQMNIPDSKEIFEEDTIRSATGVKTGACPPSYPLGRVLTHNSASAIEWLKSSFKLNLDTVSRLGGHSFPRTHRSKSGGKFPGMMITYQLMVEYDELCAKHPDKVRLITKAPVKKLLAENGRVVGVEYEKDGQVFKERGAVVVATGGFGAGVLDPKSILNRVRPDLMHLPTTNGDHCTGDGIVFSEEVGAATVDLEHVQVHPTGLVHPKEPDARVKFLAAEALRGEGGIILDRNGKRFCNEVGTRDYVSESMWKNAQGPWFLVLGKKASDAIDWHCKHYVGREVMKRYNNAKEFAQATGFNFDTLKKTLEEYNHFAKENKVDPYGRKYFTNAPVEVNEYMHVAVITPIVHYTMGGLAISPDAECIEAKTGRPLFGLYAAGEVTGGVHGKNRLGGSALLECVVFGRVAGAAASKYVKSGGATQSSGPSQGTRVVVTIEDGSGSKTTVEVFPGGSSAVSSAPTGNTYEVKSSGAVTNAIPPQPGAKAAAAESKEKVYTLAEVAKHNKEDDCWVVVNGQVLNVTKFMGDHPGGKMAILTFAGKDASEEFNMLHEKSVIQKYAPDTIIGVCKEIKSHL